VAGDTHRGVHSSEIDTEYGHALVWFLKVKRRFQKGFTRNLTIHYNNIQQSKIHNIENNRLSVVEQQLTDIHILFN
jgi:phage anti-repressor protein